MRMLQGLIGMTVLVFGQAVAEDFSVSIAGLATGSGLPAQGIGTGLNLYAVNGKGVKLVAGSPYVLPGKFLPRSSTPWGPALVAVTEDQNYAYVVYFNKTVYPSILVQFAITPKGLVYQWEQEFGTGTTYLDFLSIATVGDNLTYYIDPTGSLIFNVLDVGGNKVLSDGGDDTHLVTGHVDRKLKFYYSCRYSGPSDGPVDTVAVYNLQSNAVAPMTLSKDPGFVRSVCD